MSAQHTPGPWSIHPRRAVVVPLEHVLRPIGGASDPETDLRTYAQEICLMHYPDPHRPEAEVEANARLIAAAPDLLAAVEFLLPRTTSHKPGCSLSEVPTCDCGDWKARWEAARAAIRAARGEA